MATNRAAFNDECDIYLNPLGGPLGDPYATGVPCRLVLQTIIQPTTFGPSLRIAWITLTDPEPNGWSTVYSPPAIAINLDGGDIIILASDPTTMYLVLYNETVIRSAGDSYFRSNVCEYPIE